MRAGTGAAVCSALGSGTVGKVVSPEGSLLMEAGTCQACVCMVV